MDMNVEYVFRCVLVVFKTNGKKHCSLIIKSHHQQLTPLLISKDKEKTLLFSLNFYHEQKVNQGQAVFYQMFH